MMSNSFLGAIFAEMDSGTQAEFFNGLGRHARLAWSGIDMQCSKILDDLDFDGKSIIRRLAQMVGSEEDEQRELAEKRQVTISTAERERDLLMDRVKELEHQLIAETVGGKL